MVRPCSENARRKFTQNSIEVDTEIRESTSTQNSIGVDAETKESTRKTEEKLNGRYKEGHKRKKLK